MIWSDIQQLEVGGVGQDLLIWPASKTGNLSLTEAWKAVRCRSDTHYGLNDCGNHFKPQSITNVCGKHFSTSYPPLYDSEGGASSKIRLALFPPRLLANITHPFKKELAIIILTTTFWRIWSECNTKVFSDKRLHKLVILRRIKESIKLRTLHKVFRINQSPDLDTISCASGVHTVEKDRFSSIIKWMSPAEGWTKLNTDGSMADDRGGYGALIRNSNSDCLLGLAGRLDLPTINLLELKAIEQRVLLSCTLKVQKLWIESDSTMALAWLQGRGKVPWSAIRLLCNSHQTLQRMVDWKASHIHKEGNSPADILEAF
ncbi:hypothetical protein QJS04_geneDACA016557 [Acorus gramineus]|uniref:RNase H type-1 domain-containing protein n=1 Tax=Acorus gramineus TaxID=55184 RepID=A0AAV9BM42_ACOGR|nr:hypothetical protein QJS04_geneDACA016557 [Acorus gramineus]